MAGQDIYVIGSPLGLSNSISSGIISNPSRNIWGNDYIQFIAPISSGSSGGAFINDSGKVIGITSATHRQDEYSATQNLNFAIPIAYVQQLSRTTFIPLSDAGSILFKDYSLSVSSSSVKIGKTGDIEKITVSLTPETYEYLYISVPEECDHIIDASGAKICQAPFQ